MLSPGSSQVVRSHWTKARMRRACSSARLARVCTAPVQTTKSVWG
ncbi:MAG: hypothetical protein BWY88_00851 [Synergistetes bacterium ADurb.Bin520]|nr:MAG: hypothetical protein BWY88_00851 [Synergistetes bacterium ADurb.Bin520]